MYKCLKALRFDAASSRGLPGPRPAFPSQKAKFLGKPDYSEKNHLNYTRLYSLHLQVKEQLRKENGDTSKVSTGL